MTLNVKIWMDSRGIYHAACNDLPGCRAIGTSEVEVREKIRAAVHGYVASFHAVRPLELDHELVESCR